MEPRGEDFSRSPSELELSLWRIASGAPITSEATNKILRSLEKKFHNYLAKLTAESNKLVDYMEGILKVSQLLESLVSWEGFSSALREIAELLKDLLKVDFLEIVIFDPENPKRYIHKVTLNDTDHVEKPSRLPLIEFMTSYKDLSVTSDDPLIIEVTNQGFQPPLKVLSIPITSKCFPPKFPCTVGENKSIIGLINISQDLSLETKSFTFLKTVASLISAIFEKVHFIERYKSVHLKSLKFRTIDMRNIYELNHLTLDLDLFSPKYENTRKLMKALRAISGAKYILVAIAKVPVRNLNSDFLAFSNLPDRYFQTLKEILPFATGIQEIHKVPLDKNEFITITLDRLHPKLKKIWIAEGIKTLKIFVSSGVSNYRVGVAFYYTQDLDKFHEQLLHLSSAIVIKNLQVNLITKLLRKQLDFLNSLHQVQASIDIDIPLKDYLRELLSTLSENIDNFKGLIIVLEDQSLIFRDGEIISIIDSKLLNELEKCYQVNETDFDSICEVLRRSLSLREQYINIAPSDKIIIYRNPHIKTFLIFILGSPEKLTLQLPEESLRFVFKSIENLIHRKITYDKIKSSYTFLREVFDKLPYPIVIYNIKSGLLEFNRTALEIFKVSELKDRIFSLLKERDTKPLEMQYEGMTFLVNIIPITPMDIYLITFSDISNLKKLQFEKVIQAKLSSFGQLVASIIHELNNPLQIVTSYLYLLSQEELPPAAREYLEAINRNLDRIKNKLINLASLAHSTNISERVEINIPAYLKQAVDMIQEHYMHQGVKVELDIAPDLPIIKIAPNDLIVVLINLIQNSFDAIIDSGVGDTIKVRAYMRNDKLIIEVEDNGPGIPPEYHDKVFDPEFTTKPPEKGTGLGLALVRNILDRYSGNISFISQPGRTIFKVEIPIWAVKLEEDDREGRNG